ncbi:MAG: hypothetical protein IH598_12060 [Bacteroidales bacterium]|nr:hypothetical protein [Bacteroidales bacterium]
MDVFIEILPYTLPLLIVSGTVLIVIRLFFKQEKDRSVSLQKAEALKTILPLRLQAYERIILFLERTEPSQVISRLLPHHITARELQHEGILSIRQEFEHNFTQQLYISENAWEAVKLAKESAIHLINKSFADLKENATAGDMAMHILQQENSVASKNIEMAIRQIKVEVQDLF